MKIMRSITSLAIIGLVLLRLGFSIPANAQIISGWQEDVNGSVGLWNVRYSDPETISYHAIYLYNGKEGDSITYSYELKHAVTVRGRVVPLAEDTRDDVNGRTLKAGKTVSIYSEKHSVNLDRAGLSRGREYILDTYTRIHVVGIAQEWKDASVIPFWHSRK